MGNGRPHSTMVWSFNGLWRWTDRCLCYGAAAQSFLLTFLSYEFSMQAS